MNFIKGNQNPVIGTTFYYEVADLGTAINFSKPEELQYVWYIYKKRKNGTWEDITKNGGKTGVKVPYKFGEVALGGSYKLEVYKAIKNKFTGKFEAKFFSTVELMPSSSKNYSIQKVVLYNNGAKDPNKATYKDSLIAKAYCVAMFNKEVEFQLWEDDAPNGGHNAEINKNNKLPQIFRAKVDTNGVAEVKISLLSNEKVLRGIAEKYMSSGDKSEGSNHEYYVTASYAGKIQGASQVNVNVATSGAQQPKDSAIFPGTSNQPAKPDKEGKVTHAYFIDSKGYPTQKIKVGDSVRIRIKTVNMINEDFQYIVWEKDSMDALNDDVFRSSKMKIIGNTIDTSPITITQAKYDKGIDRNWNNSGDEDKDQQQYFIEIIPLNSKAKSVSFGIDDESKRTIVENAKSTSVVNNTSAPKTASTCICKEQYADLIWGGKVSCDFRKKVVAICEDLWKGRGLEMANGLMAVMKVETDGTFKAHQIMGKPLKDLSTMKKDDFSLTKKNGEASSRAVGLIQFTQPALELMGEFVGGSGFDKLHEVKLNFAKMGEVKQLDKVKKYFSLQPKYNKSKNTPEDIYLLVFGPEGVGKDDSTILYRENVDAEKYKQNESVDLNKTTGKDDTITRSEILTRYHKSFDEGSKAFNKAQTFTCIIKKSATDKLNVKDVINIHIFASGQIEKHIPKIIKEEYKNKYKYLYHDQNGNEHEIGIYEHNHKKLVNLNGFSGYNSGGINIGIKIKSGNEQKCYISTINFAALIGALAEIDAADICTTQFSTSDGGSPPPSVSHSNGIAGDLRYLSTNRDGAATYLQHDHFDYPRNVALTKALYKFGFGKAKKMLSENFLRNGVETILPHTQHFKTETVRHHHHLHLQGLEPNYTEIQE